MNNRLHSELLSFPDAPPVDHTHDVSEEDQIQAAIAMSLSGGGGDEEAISDKDSSGDRETPLREEFAGD